MLVKYYFIMIIILFLCSLEESKATAQFPDKLIYNGKEMSLLCNPLESYFKEHPDDKPTSEMSCTALWRGYIASFVIKDSLLFLTDIEIQYKDTTGQSCWRSTIKEVFPNQEVVKMSWWSGILVLPVGELVNYVHMGYASTYEKYILLEIRNGVLTKEIEYDTEGYVKFKEKQFQAFKKTEEYKQIKDELKEEGEEESFIDTFLKKYVIEYSTIILIDE